MAGRPSARTFIVPVDEIFSIEAIKSEKWTMKVISANIGGKEEVLIWLAKHRLIRNSVNCTRCAGPARLNKRSEQSDGYRWACNACNFVQSVRSGSFWSRSHYALDTLVQVAYMWSYDYSYKLIRHELNIGSSSLVDWGNFFRDLAVEWNNVVRLPLGGIDPDDGLGLVIEIDESAFGKNKYNRGRKPTTRWVFGGIERATGWLFAQTVLNRNANTLIPLIQQHIAWGSHIISDGWAAYDSIPSDVYTHSVVIHADNFVAPHDACIHTQNIESAWSRMKHKLKCHRGTSQALFDSYIAEHVWRSYRDCDCKFSYLIAEIIRQYPF